MGCYTFISHRTSNKGSHTQRKGQRSFFFRKLIQVDDLIENPYRYTAFSGIFQFLIPVFMLSTIYLRILLFLKVGSLCIVCMVCLCFITLSPKYLNLPITYKWKIYFQRRRASLPSVAARQQRTNLILFSLSVTFFFTWLPFRLNPFHALQ